MNQEELATEWDLCHNIQDLFEMIEGEIVRLNPVFYRKWRLMLNWIARRGVEQCGLTFAEPLLECIDEFLDGKLELRILENERHRLEERERDRRGEWKSELSRTDHAMNAVLASAYVMGSSTQQHDVMYWTYDSVADLFEDSDLEMVYQSIIFKDIFGQPFRSVIFASTWRTSTVRGIATQMYDSREFFAMPILADALQDAGCEDEAILTHCRGPGPHVRGCWVVDLVLGKQ